ncbi:MAG: class V lanthionine synthetase subunit LxmK [Rhodococcus sp. (in: high G+C Gram-positive bacteria)]
MNDILEHFHALSDTHSLGGAAQTSGERLFGRNANYRIATDRGDYFVKKLQFSDGGTKIQNCLAYDAFVARHPAVGLPLSPRILAVNAELGIIVQDFLPDAENGSTLMVEERFEPAVAADIGRSIAAVHSRPTFGVPDRQDRPTPAPTTTVLAGIPHRHLRHLTGGELQAYGLLQADAPLCDALTDLMRASNRAPRTPVHGDLRADQIMVDDATWIVDWEEFGTGDPARDTGSFLGEWLYRAVLDIPTSRGGGTAMARAEGAADVVRRGHEKVRLLAPVARAFWTAYTAGRTADGSPVDDEFIARTGAFAGWHLLDRLVAGAATNAVLPAMHRAAAGVGRSAVLDPDGVHRFLGLEDIR